MDNLKVTPVVGASEANQVTLNLNYITPAQAQNLVEMFDSAEAYAENFSALKAITKGLYKILTDTSANERTQIGRMFSVVNTMQAILLLEDMNEVWRITETSGLIPNTWPGFHTPPPVDIDKDFILRKEAINA